MNKITLKILLGITILISAFFLVGCEKRLSKKYYSISSFPRAQKQLVKAIEKADIDKVKDLAYKIDLEITNKEGVTILIASIMEAFTHKEDTSYPIRLNIISEIVRAGADLENYPSSDPDISPLHLATSYDWLLKALLDGGMSVDFINHRGVPIISKVIEGSYDVSPPLTLLIEYGADVNIIDKRNDYPLFQALLSKNASVALYLVENGAKTDIHLSSPTWNDYTFAWATFSAERDLNDPNSFRFQNYTDEEGNPMIEKQKRSVKKLKEILIERGHEWPPKEPEQLRKNREETERKAEEERLYREKYYP